jgi:hypothetical protein
VFFEERYHDGRPRPPRGQLIATKLNLANHSNSAPVSSKIKDADQQFAQFPGKLPHKVKPGSQIGQAMINDARTLREYNHGELNDNCIP